MKKILLLLLVTLAPLTVNATLLGRVNSYYSQENAKAVQDAKEKYDAAKKDSDAHADDKDKLAKTDAAWIALQRAKESMPGLSSPENDKTGVKQGTGPISISTNNPGEWWFFRRVSSLSVEHDDAVESKVC